MAAGAEKMPCVLWGVACLSLPGPTTAADVIREIREALSLQIRGSGSGAGGADKPRVDLYRLVRIEDQAGRLAGEERVVAHLPDSSWGCREIEDIVRQRDDAELRYDRARESLVSLMESLDFGEVSHPPSRSPDARPVLSMRGLPMTPQVQHVCNVLRQENKVLRYKLNQSEVLRQELQETAEMLRREFMLLVHEIMPRGSSAQQQAAASAGNSPSRLAAYTPSARVEPSSGSAATPAAATALVAASGEAAVSHRSDGMQVSPPAPRVNHLNLSSSTASSGSQASSPSAIAGGSPGSRGPASPRATGGGPGSGSPEQVIKRGPPQSAVSTAGAAVERPEASPWVAAETSGLGLGPGILRHGVASWSGASRPGPLLPR